MYVVLPFLLSICITFSLCLIQARAKGAGSAKLWDIGHQVERIKGLLNDEDVTSGNEYFVEIERFTLEIQRAFQDLEGIVSFELAVFRSDAEEHLSSEDYVPLQSDLCPIKIPIVKGNENGPNGLRLRGSVKIVPAESPTKYGYDERPYLVAQPSTIDDCNRFIHTGMPCLERGKVIEFLVNSQPTEPIKFYVNAHNRNFFNKETFYYVQPELEPEQSIEYLRENSILKPLSRFSLCEYELGMNAFKSNVPGEAILLHLYAVDGNFHSLFGKIRVCLGFSVPYLKSENVRKFENGLANETCAICLEKFSEEKNPYVYLFHPRVSTSARAGHFFCLGCANEHKRNKGTCPICRNVD